MTVTFKSFIYSKWFRQLVHTAWGLPPLVSQKIHQSVYEMINVVEGMKSKYFTIITHKYKHISILICSGIQIQRQQELVQDRWESKTSCKDLSQNPKTEWHIILIHDQLMSWCQCPFLTSLMADVCIIQGPNTQRRLTAWATWRTVSKTILTGPIY